MVTELLDAGTAKKSKDIIREALGARGISVSFSAGGDRTYFAASCLPEDITFALQTIVECLTEATFPAAEIKSAKERALGDLIEEKSETRTVAATALSRMIYDPSHVNYAETIAERKRGIDGITRADLLAFRKTLGQGGLIFAITGDISPESTLKSAIKVLSKLPKGTESAAEKIFNKKKPTSQMQTVDIPNKANIDTYAGLTMPFNNDNPLYRPFIILTEMLGGRGFTSHLMQTIRERDGLTYAVYSMPSGFSDEADGIFRIWATFSPNKFDESVTALKKEILHFFTTKVTAEGLLTRQEEIIGGYAVGLSTSRGLASMLHKVGIDGKQLSYIDE
jgi:zinc protease